MEIDGAHHAEKTQQQWDINRTADFNINEIEVLRFTNDEVNNYMNDVLSRILLKCQEIVKKEH